MLTLNLPSRIPTKELYRRMHGAFRADNVALQSMLFNRLCFECGAQNAIVLANSIGDSVRFALCAQTDWKNAPLLSFERQSVARRPYRLFSAIKRNNESLIRKQDDALKLSADSSLVH